MGYKFCRIPLDTYQKLIDKKRKIENYYYLNFRKPVKIPITKLLKAISEHPIFISDDYLIKLFEPKIKRGKNI